MRQHGVVASAAGLVPFGHLGWGFRDRAEFRKCAAEYIADGLAQNQRVEYTGEGSRDELWAELATMPGTAGHLDDGGIRVTPVLEFHGADGSDIVDPQTAVATRIAALEKAIDHGYTGLRAVVDATALARRPDQRDAFACFEFLIDQQMAMRPVSTLHGYDTSQLGDEAVGLVCLHPYVCQSGPTFQLYADPQSGFALAGEIDAASDHVFATALRRIWPLAGDDTVVIDAQQLEFIAHQQLQTLDHYARTTGRKVVLRTDQRIPTRLAGLLELTNVRVEPPDVFNDDEAAT
ncbi:MAG: MEDS domain-containing protein [Mycobacterium sp.]|nr:MEDS domain-containing protein [Mycobacterium sp.]